MTSDDGTKPSIAATGWRSRRERVSTGGSTWPFAIDVPADDAGAWIERNAERVSRELARHGAVLLRGLESSVAPPALAHLTRIIVGEPLAYHERSSPRTELGHGVYTSTDYPADQPIFFHNENAYASVFPGVLIFACAVPAAEGGETPLVDCRKVVARLSTSVRECFERVGVQYVRRHGNRLGIDWRLAYGTSDRNEVLRRLTAAGYAAEWHGDMLEARRVGPALVLHPTSGVPCWFNHAAFFHVTTLPQKLAEAMLAELGEQGLPNQTSFGDGTPIDTATLEEIRNAYRAEAVWHRWQRGDVLLVDNVAVAHGRAPFRGERRIHVSMARQYVTVGEGGIRRVEVPA